MLHPTRPTSPVAPTRAGDRLLRQSAAALKPLMPVADDMPVAAESGEQRAARLRAAAHQDPAKRRSRLAAAARIEQGNVGERHVAQLLEVLNGTGWVVLHDRYKNLVSPANLDHIAVGPPGVFVIDSKNWTGGRLRYDDRGMALGRYRRDDELHNAKVDADIVRRIAASALPALSDVSVVGVLAFVEDVGLTAPVHHQHVVLLHAEQLPGWLTSRPARLTPTEVHQVSSTLDAALPPREGSRRPLVRPAAAAVAPPGPATRATPPPRSHSGGRPTTGASRRGRPARTAGQELTDGLRRLVGLLALIGLIVFVAFPIANRVLPPLLTHLLQATLTSRVPIAPPPGPTVPTGTCAPTLSTGTTRCAPP